MKTRKIIIVGQGIEAENEILSTYGIEMAPAPTVEYVFDTHTLSIEVFGTGRQHTLRKLTELLGLKENRFHNAGKDANIALRNMLLEAIRNFDATKCLRFFYSRSTRGREGIFQNE